MKIIHLIYAFPTGGKETMLVDIINEQAKYASISLVVVNNWYDKTLISKISDKVSVHLVNRIEGSRNPLPLLKLNSILVKTNPDVLHCHDYSIAELILPLTKPKKILTIHEINNYTKYYYKYQQLFAISDAVQNNIKQNGFDSKVIYNGIKVENVILKHTNDTASFKIVQVGRLDHVIKGQHILLEALSFLINKYKLENLHIDFIGEGTSLKYLSGLVDKLSLNSYVSFLGLCDREYIYSHLKDYDLLVQPSLSEGFGLTIVEALAAGIEVLVSDINGPGEIVDKTGYGYKFKSGNAEDCAIKIKEIFSNPKLFESQERSELRRQVCKKYFDVEVISKKYLAEYKTLINS